MSGSPPIVPMSDEALLALPALVDVLSAAHALGVSRDTLYVLIMRGEIDGARKIGHQWRIPKRTLLEWARLSEPLPDEDGAA